MAKNIAPPDPIAPPGPPYAKLPQARPPAAAQAREPSVADLADGLRRLLEMTDAERAAMGERGRAIVERRYAWPAVGEKLLAVYRWVLGDGAVPDGVVTAP